MESAVKQGVNGGVRHGTGDEGKAQAGAGFSAGILRLLVVAMTLVAALVMATASETQMVSIVVAPTLPPLPVPVTAKAAYSSAFILHRGQRDRVRVLRMLACGRRPKKRQQEGVDSAHLHLGRGHGGAPLLRQRRRRGVRSAGPVRKLSCRLDEGLQRLRQVLPAGIGFHRRLADSLGQSAGARHTLDGWPPQEIVGLKGGDRECVFSEASSCGVALLLLCFAWTP
ncbi:hypothetical protein B296_00032939 [Ensete ventricosum]|uniref:CASP-like protein n=1 Tax=Ensete ventricosum TaxID=4639 RepID=A0A426ZQX6_ENSVE|nr:hypothetical protein B296_00032939 [Ensete ventricosum]